MKSWSRSFQNAFGSSSVESSARGGRKGPLRPQRTCSLTRGLVCVQTATLTYRSSITIPDLSHFIEAAGIILNFLFSRRPCLLLLPEQQDHQTWSPWNPLLAPRTRLFPPQPSWSEDVSAHAHGQCLHPWALFALRSTSLSSHPSPIILASLFLLVTSVQFSPVTKNITGTK